jgi:Tfp pilus assembly protein PilF
VGRLYTSILWGCLFLFVALPAVSPASSGRAECSLRVTVSLQTGAPAGPGYRVELVRGINGDTPFTIVTTNSAGTAEFQNLEPGEYRVIISGQGILTEESATVRIGQDTAFQNASINVRISDDARPTEVHSMSPAVSVSDLNVPKKASNEFERGNVEMDNRNWGKALDHFTKAVSIYPKYSGALYAEAVVYNRLSQPDKQRYALELAISANGHCVPALIGLAKMDVTEKKNAEASDLLYKAVLAEPANVESLAMLSRVDFFLGQYERTIADAQRVHRMPHEHYAWIHYTAATAYERLGNFSASIAELKTYLLEDPQSPRADSVRQAIAEMENRIQ